MKTTYVKMVEDSKRETESHGEEINVYCPIDLENKSVTLGLTLIGFLPDGAECVGAFEESTGVFIPNWAKDASVNHKITKEEKP